MSKSNHFTSFTRYRTIKFSDQTRASR